MISSESSSAFGDAQRDRTDQAPLAELVSELTDRFTHQSSDEVNEWIAEQGEAAARLRQLLPPLRRLALLGQRIADQSGRQDAVIEVAGNLGDFDLIREIGRGGMGIVFEAKQRSLARHVAVKILPECHSLDPNRVARFRNEANLVATLQHPHIVPIYCIGFDAGVHFYAMQLIEGITLAQHLADPESRRGLSDDQYARQVARWGVQVSAALAHTHELGVIHRDIKPSNLLLDTNQNLWVTDFGVARLNPTRQRDSMGDPVTAVSLTRTGSVPGTLRYMSPEQAAGTTPVDGASGQIDHRSDIYSLGAVLYELLSGRPLVSGDSPIEIIDQLLRPRVQDLKQRMPSVAPELETIVMKAVAQHPIDRFDNADALAADLNAFLQGHPIAARRPTRWRRWELWRARNRMLVRASVFFLILGFVGSAIAAGLILHQRQDLRHERQRRVAQRVLLQQQQRIANEHRYTVSIQLAYQAWRHLDRDGMLEHLQFCKGDLLRGEKLGFEWAYLDALQQSVPTPIGRHRGEAYSVRFNSDGKTFTTGGDDGQRIWDMKTGALVRHQTVVGEVSPARELWQQIQTAVGFDGEFTDVIAQLDGERFAIRQQNNRLVILDISGENQRAEIVIPGRIASLAVSHESGLLAIGDGDGNVYLGTVDKLAVSLMPPFRMAENAIESLHFQSDNSAVHIETLVTSSRDGSAGIWTIESQNRVASVVGQRIFRTTVPLWDAQLSPTRKVLVITDRQGQVLCWDLSQSTLQHPRLRSHAFYRNMDGAEKRETADASIRFDLGPDRVLAMSIEHGALQFWNTDDNEWVCQFSGDDLRRIEPEFPTTPVQRSGFSADGKHVYVLAENQVYLFRCQQRFDSKRQQLAIALTRAAVPEVLTSPRPTRCHWHPRRSMMVVVHGGSSRGEVIDLDSGRAVADLVEGIADLAWTSDGGKLITCEYDGVFRVWDAETFEEQTPFVGPVHSQIAITPDGRTLATTSGAEIILWNTTSYREMLRIPLPHPLLDVSLEFSSDGRSLVAEHNRGGEIAQYVWEVPRTP